MRARAVTSCLSYSLRCCVSVVNHHRPPGTALPQNKKKTTVKRKEKTRSLPLTHSRRSDGAPEPVGALRESARTKIRHYRQLYINRPDPIAFMPVTVDTSGRIYDDFSRLLFLHTHREASALTNELQEESEQFRFLRTACYADIKGSVGLIFR